VAFLEIGPWGTGVGDHSPTEKNGSVGFDCMEYNGDLYRYYIRKYWDEAVRKFDDCGTQIVDFFTKYNPEVITYSHIDHK